MAPVRTRKITYKEYVRMMGDEINESQYIDFKSIKDKAANVTTTISSLANADGGEIYLGIEERTDSSSGKQEKIKYWEGFKKQEEANDFVSTIDRLFTHEEECSYEFLSYGNSGLILHIVVPRTRNLIKSSDGKVYLRRNASDQRQHDEKIVKILYDKGIESYEKQTLSSIELEEVTNSETILEFLTSQCIEQDPTTWLRKHRLISKDKDLITICSVLLFSDFPQAIIPKNCGIKIYRYKTSDDEGFRENLDFDPITVEGNIYNQIKNAVEKTRGIIESIPKLGSLGLEKIHYPIETLHEIITNAVLHRDYSMADDIHIRIFDNRVEVVSPGRLPGHITTKNIYDERYSRNPSLTWIINKFPNPPNKDVGEGLNTASNAMKNLGLKAPVIEQKDHSVVIFIRHEQLASCEEIIVEYLSKYESATVSTIKKICHFRTDKKYRETINRLKDRGLIEHIPDTHGIKSSYRKGTSSKQIN